MVGGGGDQGKENETVGGKDAGESSGRKRGDRENTRVKRGEKTNKQRKFKNSHKIT